MKSKYKRIKLPDGSTRDEHRLIMEEIVGRKLDFNEVVHHIDEDGMNNDPTNLEIKSRSDHSRDHFDPSIKPPMTEEVKKKLSFLKQGSKSNLAILNEEKVRQIKIRILNGEKNADLAREFGVKRNTVSDIRHEKTWKHIEI